MMVRGDVLSAQCPMELASSSSSRGGLVSGRAAAGRRTKMARIGEVSPRFGSSAAKTELSSSYSTSCRLQRMTVTTSSSRGSGVQEGLRSRPQQPDAVLGAAADGRTGEEEDEVSASFWDRLQLAWRVLMGAPNEAQVTKKRFSRLLVRDRGFNAANLSRLYNAAKGAIKEHVELEVDEDTEVAAVVDRLGELRLDFRVKRVKSVLRDEPFSDSVLPELEPSSSISEELWWEDKMAPHDYSQVRVGITAEEPLLNAAFLDEDPSLSTSGDQLWEYGRTPIGLKARLRVALDRSFPVSVVPDGELVESPSAGPCCEDKRATQDLEVAVRGVPSLKSSTSEEGRDELSPASARLDEQLDLSISGDQLWIDRMASEDSEHQLGGLSNLTSFPLAGLRNEPFATSILRDEDPTVSTYEVYQDESRAREDLAREASVLLSTADVVSDGEWFTFSFIDPNVADGTGPTVVDADRDKQQQ